LRPVSLRETRQLCCAKLAERVGFECDKLSPQVRTASSICSDGPPAPSSAASVTADDAGRELDRVVKMWPTLPAAIRKAILALVAAEDLI
jgi:hypothetical protein